METVSLVVSVLSLAAFLWVSWILWKDSKRSVKVSYKRLLTEVGLENGGVLAPPKGKLVVELLSKKKLLGLGFVRFDAGGDLAGQRIVFDYRKSFQIQGAKFLLPPHPDNTANKRNQFELVVVPRHSVLCVLQEIPEWVEETKVGEQKMWGYYRSGYLLGGVASTPWTPELKMLTEGSTDSNEAYIAFVDAPNHGLTLTAPPRATFDAAKDQAEQAAEAQQVAAMQKFDIPVPWTTTIRELIEELNGNQQN